MSDLSVSEEMSFLLIPAELEITVREDAYPLGWVHLSPETYDLFHDGYVALADALVRARAFVAQIAPAALLSQIDDALAMKSNLNERR
jgi:hypothetical protein